MSLVCANEFFVLPPAPHKKKKKRLGTHTVNTAAGLFDGQEEHTRAKGVLRGAVYRRDSLWLLPRRLQHLKHAQNVDE